MWEIGLKCNLMHWYIIWAYKKTERNQKQGYVPFLKTCILKDICKKSVAMNCETNYGNCLFFGKTSLWRKLLILSSSFFFSENWWLWDKMLSPKTSCVVNKITMLNTRTRFLVQLKTSSWSLRTCMKQTHYYSQLCFMRDSLLLFTTRL